MVGSATVSVTGAAGVAAIFNNAGKGDEVSGVLTLSYGESFTICVDFGGGAGGATGSDYQVASGGGASSIATSSLLLVGGGGGGATDDGNNGGGNAGYPNATPTNESGCNGYSACGLGGTSSAPGQGGASFIPQGGSATQAGSPGTAHTATEPGSGGNGGNATGTFHNIAGGGGGGGGYYGGGGGTGGENPSNNYVSYVGGGGSDYCASTVSNCSVTSGAGTQHAAGTSAGDAEVVITMNQSPTSLGITAPSSENYGTSISLSSIAASLTGGNSPTGSINFYYVVEPTATAPSSCANATQLGSSVPVRENGTYVPTTSFNVSQAGFVFWYATYSGDGANEASTTSCGASDTQITPADQSISYATPPPNPSVGDTYVPHPEGGPSGNPVSESIGGATTNNACTLIGTTVEFEHVGSCTIDFEQSGITGVYNDANSSLVLSVAKASQTVTISAPSDPTVGGSYNPTLTGGASGDTVVLTVDPSTAIACTTNGTTVTFVHAGACQLDANQAGGDDYNDGVTSISFDIAKAVQTPNISFPTDPTVNGSYEPTLTEGESGEPVVLTVASATTNGACTTDGTTVTFVHAGACQLFGTEDGNNDYNGGGAIIEFEIAKASQTVTISAPTDPTVNGSYAPNLTGGGSNEPVVLTVDSSTPSACTTDGTIVTFVHAGACQLDANQAGGDDYNDGSTSISFDIAKASQTVTISAPADPTVNGTYAPTLTGGGSNEPVVLTVDSATINDTCIIDAAVVKFVHAGSCVLDATQAGNNYYVAGVTSISFDIAKAAQTVTISAPADPTVNGTYAPTLTGGGSGDAVVLTVDNATTNGACTTNGTTVSFVHAGLCVLDANQAGNGDYKDGSDTINFGIAKASQSVTIPSPTNPAAGGQYTPVTTGGGSGNEVVLTVDKTTTNGACTTDGTIVYFAAPGTCVLDVAQAGDDDYTGASSSINFAVAAAPQGSAGPSPVALAFTSVPPTPAVVGGTYDPTAAGGVPGVAITFSVDVTTTSDACSIDGSVVTFVHAGQCVLDATQPSTATSASSTVSQSFSVQSGAAPALVTPTTTVLHISPLKVTHSSDTLVRLEVVVRGAHGILISHGLVTIPGVKRLVVVKGRATVSLKVATLRVGVHTLYAVYGGYASYGDSTSRRVTLIVS